MKNDTIHQGEPWYIAKVVSITDPDKRRRIQVRGPRELEDSVPDKKLQWISPCMLSPSDFWLPKVGEPVLILRFGDLRMWLELPNSKDWSEYDNDDYGTAFMHKHHDVLEQTYKLSEGFVSKYVGDIKTQTDSTTLVIKKDTVDFTFDNVHIVTDGSSLKITVKSTEISTDGNKITIKNGGVNLADALDELEQALLKHNHQSPAGPTSPPINAGEFSANKAKLKQLLK